jgi:hypothetical protein
VYIYKYIYQSIFILLLHAKCVFQISIFIHNNNENVVYIKQKKAKTSYKIIYSYRNIIYDYIIILINNENINKKSI